MVARRTVIILSSIAASAAFLYCCRRWLASSSLSHHKPQRNFKIVLADNSTQPFVHLQRLQDTGTTEVHPFHDEISILLQCSSSPPKLTSTEAGPPPMTASYTWIETKAQLVKLAEVLSHESEFAVDTEQHSVRSFLGFTALVQVSTRKQDFLIDAIALHDEMGILRNVFADSSIRKVFHGADSDILWLQRDFHIYIANLFDTAKACDVLGKPQRSLAYLLQNYCGIVTNKTFQRADWRLRPLPVEMIEYAQMDAHYLLYISDCLQNELVQGRSDDGTQHYLNDVNIDGTGSPYGECVRRSNLMCLQLYEKDGPSSSPGTVASSLFSRYHGHLNPHRSNPDYKSKWASRIWRL